MGSICDVPGITVGHAQDATAMTGCTVILTPDGAVAGVDVRGSAPGTRETDLLDPQNLVQTVQAIALCGGSAFGLAAATGVVQWLYEHDYGFKTNETHVPIVPAAVIYDLGVGAANVWPDAAMGYRACTVADTLVAEGNIGAGTGASVGKVLGASGAMKSGVGTASLRLNFTNPTTGESYQYTVGALVVTNAFGDIYDGENIIAGAQVDGKFVNSSQILRDNSALLPAPLAGQNTTIAVVATNAPLTKGGCRKMAQMAHDGMARAIRPAHTMFDGDTIFALSTGGLPTTPTTPLLITILGSVASDVLALAIVRSVTQAAPTQHLPAVSSFHQSSTL